MAGGGGIVMSESPFASLSAEAKIERLREAVETLAWWLVQAQSGLGERDARGIHDLIEHGPRNLDGE